MFFKRYYFFLFSALNFVPVLTQGQVLNKADTMVEERGAYDDHSVFLKPYNHIIDSNAQILSDSSINKDGLYQIDSVSWWHFHYWCAITDTIGNTIARGYIRNNQPDGVWIKYNTQIRERAS